MPVGAPNLTTASTTLVRNYRKVAASVMRGFNTECEEFSWIDDIPESDVTLSAREMLFPVDLNPAVGPAMIPEAGIEANPVTPQLEEGTASLVFMNARFQVSKFAKYLDGNSRAGMVERQVRYQAIKRLEAMANRVGFQFYGYSTGIVAEVTAAVTAVTATYTLRDAFGDDNLDSAAYLDQLINVGEFIVLARTGTLVANSFGEVIATGKGAAASTIVVVHAGTVTSAAGDAIHFANNAIVSGTLTLADHSDQNKWPLGLKDMTESTSVHGINGATTPNWNPSFVDTASAAFDPTKALKMAWQVENFSGRKLQKLIVAPGVYFNMAGQRSASYRFTDPGDISFDLGLKGRVQETPWVTSRKVPNGHIFGIARPLTKTKGGILIPEAQQSEVNFGEIVATGPGLTLNNGVQRAMPVSVGQTVLLPGYAGVKLRMGNDQEYWVYRDDDILGILEEPVSKK